MEKILKLNGCKDTKEDISKLLRSWNIKYRNGNPEVSDQVFDDMFDYYVGRYGHISLMDGVGWNKTAPLKYVLGSMNKVKTFDDLQEWVGKYDGKIHLSGKFDGISILKTFMVAQTRGDDGLVGTIVTDNFIKINDGEAHLLSHKDKRGECVISWENFKKHFPDDKHPRNTVAGLFRDKIPSDKLQYVDFLVFDEYSDGFRNSTDNEFHIIINSEELSEELLMGLFVKWNETYPCDGIVVEKMLEKADMLSETGTINPKSARAFKHKGFYQTAETTVTMVKRQISKYGRFSPVLGIDPVMVEGGMISSIYVDHETFLKTVGIGIGTKITIIRSGGIIPRLLVANGIIIPTKRKELLERFKEFSVEENRQWLLDGYSIGEKFEDRYQEPTFDYKWDGLDIVMIEKDERVEIEKCYYFTQSLKIKNIGKEIIREIFLKGFAKDLSSFIMFDFNNMRNQDGWGVKRVKKITDELERKLKRVRMETLMSSVSIFKGLGEDKLKIFLLYGYDGKGLGEVSIDTIKNGIEEWDNIHKIFIDKGIEIISPSENEDGEVYCHTNCRIDEETKSKIIEDGGTVVDGWSNKVTILVCSSIEDDTSKIRKAKAREKDGVKIITMKELIEKYPPNNLEKQSVALF